MYTEYAIIVIPLVFVKHIILTILFYIFKEFVVLGNFCLALLSFHVWNHIIQIYNEASLQPLEERNVKIAVFNNVLFSGCINSHCILVVYKSLSKTCEISHMANLIRFFCVLGIYTAFSINTLEKNMIKELPMQASVFIFVTLFQIFVLSYVNLF